MLSFIKKDILFWINIFYYTFGISSLVVYFYFYEHDKDIIKDHYNHIFLFHISLYVNIPVMTTLTLINNHIFLLAWLLALNLVDFMTSFLSFINYLYMKDCPTYLYLVVYLHLSIVLFLGLCIRYIIKNKEINTDTDYVSI